MKSWRTLFLHIVERINVLGFSILKEIIFFRLMFIIKYRKWNSDEEERLNYSINCQENIFYLYLDINGELKLSKISYEIRNVGKFIECLKKSKNIVSPVRQIILESFNANHKSDWCYTISKIYNIYEENREQNKTISTILDIIRIYA